MSKPITYYCDCPATQAIAAKYGDSLSITAHDKMDALWVIVTSIGFSEQKGGFATLQETQEKWGSIFPNAPHSEEFLRTIDESEPEIPDLLGIAKILAAHIADGDYADE